ncbi:MAG: zinc-binding dehydrogenase [Candidatus Lokiarchaeota archaeon]|nr:zinc-binding dehydrogenase [Candidatus Lokiarchaeota archaeon]
MKAAFITQHGDPENIQIGEVDTPQIGPNEILIETKFGALNHIDLFVVKGWPGLSLKMPHVLGSDGSGIVKEIGSEITTLKKGDRVSINPGISCGKCGMCLAGKQNFCDEFSILGENQWGTFAEYIKIPEINVIKIPTDFTLIKAAAAPLTFLTAWRMLVTRAKIQHHDMVFIHGAGGGVATAAIQIAKFFDTEVITSTSTQEKMERAKMIGADHVINYKEHPDFEKHVYTELTNKQGVDIVIDSVGHETFQKSIRLLKPGGRLITCGATTGPKSEIDIRHIFWKQLQIKGSTMSNQKEFRDVMNLVFSDKITPIIDKTYNLDEIVEAEKYLGKANQFGKVILKIS